MIHDYFMHPFFQPLIKMMHKTFHIFITDLPKPCTQFNCSYREWSSKTIEAASYWNEDEKRDITKMNGKISFYLNGFGITLLVAIVAFPWNDFGLSVDKNAANEHSRCTEEKQDTSVITEKKKKNKWMEQ